MKLTAFILCGVTSLSTAFAADSGFAISWTNNLLTVSNANLPGGKLEIWYPEAFCRKGSRDRDWGETVLERKTELMSASPRSLLFRTTIGPEVVALHSVDVYPDWLELIFSFHNSGTNTVDLEWFQPACIRVADFTGCNQSNYTSRSFIFTERGLTTLDKTDRRGADEARYHGGQVYVPKGINVADVNPRPICHDAPTNGLIGCFSADGKYLLATASDYTHELFEGVYVCLHSDPHVGQLGSREMKWTYSQIYFVTNDPAALLKRYQSDFSGSAKKKSPASF